MKLEKRIDILAYLGNYLSTDNPDYIEARERAYLENKWFLPEYIFQAGKAIGEQMLNTETLKIFAEKYELNENAVPQKKIGIVLAGNIPYVGLHDILCSFICGYTSLLKLSSKDTILVKHILGVLTKAFPEIQEYIQIRERLNECDAYIATGSDNSARHFEYYFGKYPHIIRKNKTSIAILDGNETKEDLINLADDIHMYFGLGCRNVTQIFVPKNYDFIPLLNALKKYEQYRDHEKYRNNFDYQLTIAIMNNVFYMSNESILLIESQQLFSPIAQLHYQFYDDKKSFIDQLDMSKIQCIVGKGYISFGKAQKPEINDFADGIDTMDFLKNCFL